jgi:hypothetical protein
VGGRSIGAKRRLRRGCNLKIYFWKPGSTAIRRSSVRWQSPFAQDGNFFLDTDRMREKSYGRRSMHRRR